MIDAHCHVGGVRRDGVVDRQVVNSVSEEGWGEIRGLVGEVEGVVPGYGVHPWEAGGVREGWLGRLRGALEVGRAVVGEVGLDRGRGPGLGVQVEVFEAQVGLAGEMDRGVAVHCVRRWGALVEVLQRHVGGRFLLHSFAGPGEMVGRLVELGCWFSFNCGQTRQEEVSGLISMIPRERLLLETDAVEVPDGDLAGSYGRVAGMLGIEVVEMEEGCVASLREWIG